MTGPEPSGTPIHEDADLFREAVNFTAAETSFPPLLVEKDYFCTLLLEYLAAADDGLVFKGGTCLAKVHGDFYRLSEDLDFVVPMPSDAPRATRSARAAGVKRAATALARELPVFRVVRPMTGANSSTQYIATAAYRSRLDGQDGTVKIEVGLREPLFESALTASARTLLLDPVSGQPLLTPRPVRCISRTEAFAEKFRAGLTRREPAIRDFYDLDYAVRRLDLRPQDAALLQLVRRKLAVPGNAAVDVSEDRLAELRRQLDGRLKAVLRPHDFAGFDLERAFQMVTEMAARIAS
jgi:predicted nucleotidyltransferase component of viral defense system